jgi:hypothetical protein
MEKNQKLPVLGELEATDPKQIVTWAKKTLTCGKAFPKTFERINVLHFCVSKDIRDMWAALTEGVEGAPADDYPSDIDSDSKEEEELAKKRDWHYEWLDTVISYYGTNQKDDVYEAIRRRVEWSNDPSMQTMVKVRRWALSCSRAQNAVAPEAWDEADPKTLFTACAKVLPEPIRTLLQQNKPEGGQHTWQTAAKFLDQRTMACEADDVFRNAVEFVGPESSRSRSFGNSNSNSTSNGQQRQQQWRGRGAKGAGQRGRGRGQWRNPHATADEEKEPDASRGKGSSKGKSGKGKGKASGKSGDKRKRDGKGDADAKPAKKKKKDEVTCFNCGEAGHYRNQCKNPLRITDGSADAEE